MKSIAISIRPDRVVALALCALRLVVAETHAQTDPLPSWSDGPAKQGVAQSMKSIAFP